MLVVGAGEDLEAEARQAQVVGRRRFLFLGGAALAGTVVGARSFESATEYNYTRIVRTPMGFVESGRIVSLHGDIVFYRPSASPLLLLASALQRPSWDP